MTKHTIKVNIDTDHEEGRFKGPWRATETLSGSVGYGPTQEAACDRALAHYLRFQADLIEHGDSGVGRYSDDNETSISFEKTITRLEKERDEALRIARYRTKEHGEILDYIAQHNEEIKDMDLDDARENYIVALANWNEALDMRDAAEKKLKKLAEEVLDSDNLHSKAGLYHMAEEALKHVAYNSRI